MGPPSRSTLMGDLPMTVVRELESLLNVDNRWSQLVDNIPKDVNSDEFVPKYTALHRSAFERAGLKPRGSATLSVLDDWSSMNPTVAHLLAALSRANLFSCVRYLTQEFLKEETTIPPPAPPSFPCLDLPPPSLDICPSSHSRRGHASARSLTSSAQFYDKLTKLQPDNVNFDGSHDKSDLYKSIENREEGEFFSMGGSDDHLLQTAPSMSRDKWGGHGKEREIQSLLSCEPVICREVRGDVGFIHHVAYDSLKVITDNFNNKDASRGGRVIGRGGFGVVYLGIDHDNQRVAVKKMMLQHDTSVKQFKAELTTLSQHRHVNLLPLLAYSCDSDDMCIVYDFMPSGSLEDRLALKGGSPSLPPCLRIDIASGSGHGIHYLNSRGLIHRDIKSANILLDEKFTPKLGDFATTRLGPSGASKTVQETTTVIGTPSYLAPEAHCFDVSAKLDSFSFGVVLLELLTALPAFDANRENKDLRSHVMDEEADIADLLDHSGGSWRQEAVSVLYDVARRCLHFKKKKRVTVSEIIQELDDV